MVLLTKSIFEPAEEEDGIRILITRFYPRGVKRDHLDEWARVLSPSSELLMSYKRGAKDWESLKRQFVLELRDGLDGQEAILTLNQLSKIYDITLLCYEKSGAPCHRHLVRDIIENAHLT